MNNMSMEAEVMGRLREILGISDCEIAMEDDLGTMGLDSIKSIRLVVELEALFDVEFGDEELLFENFSTLHKIMKRIQNKMETRS